MLTVHNTASPWPRTCDSCQAAAPAFYCRADLAYLCVGCDAEIHSANPLARRHHRVPIGNPSGGGMLPLIGRSGGDDDCGGFLRNEEDDDDDEDLETASWLVDKGVFGEGVDEYLDLEEYTSCENANWEINKGYAKQAQQQDYSYGGDCVVPIQTHKGKEDSINQSESQSAAVATAPSISLNHVSPSSMEGVGVVPESTISEWSTVSPTTRPRKGTIDLFCGSPVLQVRRMDREARVLRYKEKKKKRKFEKTIRYASRKAYAESRPRIKGRFAKRRDGEEVKVDEWISMNAYGIVPLF